MGRIAIALSSTGTYIEAYLGKYGRCTDELDPSDIVATINAELMIANMNEGVSYDLYYSLPYQAVALILYHFYVISITRSDEKEVFLCMNSNTALYTGDRNEIKRIIKLIGGDVNETDDIINMLYQWKV